MVTSSRVLLRGVAVAYDLVGDGVPVVVLHGWGAQAAAVRPIVDCLQDRWQVCAPDLPGFGASMAPPVAWSVRDYAEVVQALMERLGMSTAHIIGHSFGGRVGIVLASESPTIVQQLVLVNSAGVKQPERLKDRLQAAAMRGGRLVLGAAGRPAEGRWRDRLRSWAAERFRSDDYRSAGQLRPTFLRVVNEDLRSRLPAIQAPTLLIWGDQDQETPLVEGRLMAEAIPDARLEVFAGAGHYSYLDQPAEFCDLVCSFLRS
ncbi:MAG: alpha/beta hydrolase [Dehalococcoidia bacterium]|nr:alpha/beta hydrolase [Dehalococcoidia bacterium]